MSGPIEAKGLTKRFGEFTAVDGVTFSVRPGQVTGFLGRNGTGKTTTLRMMLGLERPTSGSVQVDGRPYAELTSPLRHVGSLLDARAVQPASTAADHLLALARSNRIGRHRVDEVLEIVGLADVGRKPARTFSLGMLQRLGLAAALLGDPPILVLDEPLNGLDPEGIIWFRNLMRRMAAEGRTVLVSSHVMAEMSVTADHLLIIGEGRLLVDSELKAFEREHEQEEIHVRTPDPRLLHDLLVEAGGVVRELDATSFAVSGLDGAVIGALALRAGVELDESASVRRSLEDAFMEITAPTGADVMPPEPSHEPSANNAATEKPSVVRFRDILRSELTKFRSSRTRPLLVAGSMAASIGLAALGSNASGEHYPDLDQDERRAFDPTETSLKGRFLTQVTLGVLGALAMTSEYDADTIVPTLAAVPDRPRLLAAKALTTAGISLGAGLVANTAAFLIGQAMLARHDAPHATFRSPGSARAVLGGGLHSTASALLGLGIGTLTRSTAGAISTLFGAELLVPAFEGGFPKPLPDLFAKYWPTDAGARILTTRPAPKLLGPWGGLAVMAGATAALLGTALTAFHRRDV
ncbi:MAG TPA: ATP-binding cassette domain-containing protein [Lacisediminihabitans sp.]|uniref:ATP-binding cassette domain-containing protein n=1 Tax=Lacisediminihabitans sp. TaxID=2787631 RepID=UPI002ED998FB